MMKHLFISIATCVLLTSVSACGSKSGTPTGDKTDEADSLRLLVAQKSADYEELSGFVNIVAVSLDSITQAEDMLVRVVNPEDGKPSRESIKAGIAEYAALIARQKARIAELSDSLKVREGKDGANVQALTRLHSMIEYLNGQISAKDSQLAQLQRELTSSKANVTQLTQTVSGLKSNVASLKQNVSNLEVKNEKLDQALTVQDEVLNECYIKYGTKKELAAAGILAGGGFLRKKKLDYGSFASAGFQKVDIRHFTQLAIPAKKAKLLTAAPSGSYTLTKATDGQWILHITDPSAFWSVSNYMVIQTD